MELSRTLRHSRMSLSGIHLVFSLLLLFPANVLAGAWTREKGEVYSKLAVSRFESDEVFAAKGNKKNPGPDFEDTSLSLYTEYGFTPKWTGIFSVEQKFLSTKVNGVEATNEGLADGWFLIKRGLLTDPFVFSIQFGVKLPLGYSRLSNPPLGDGQVDLEARLLTGKSFHPLSGYGNAEIGYRKRNGDVSDEMVFLVETGFFVHKKVLLKVVYDGVQSEANDTASTVPNLGATVFDEEFSKVSPAVLFFLPKGWGLEFSYATLVTGGNTAAGDTISVGLFWQGKP